jgi:hypothetical protein
MRKIILFELNEVPFTVLDYFCKKFPASHLAKTLPFCAQYETYTADKGELHPWATWPTLHRGVSSQQHQIKDFGQNRQEIDKEYPPVWAILNHHKISTGVFASMNSYPMPQDARSYAFYVPDPFAADGKAYPARVIPFQEFNLAMSRRSEVNAHKGIDVKSALKMLGHLPYLGITRKTLTQVIGQLLKEKVTPHLATRRRTYQSVLAFDVYLKLLRTGEPRFSTYFSNHVASTLHRYWAATFPNDYEVNNLPQQWITKYGGEIDFAMKKFDEIFEELTAFVDTNPAYKIIVASSMGQKGTIAELVNTRTCVKDVQRLMARLGLQADEWENRPAMHPQCNVVIHEAKIQVFTNALERLDINKNPLQYRCHGNGHFSLDFGQVNLAVDYAILHGEKISFKELGLGNEPVDDESAGTAYHIPEGSLFIYDPVDTVTEKERKYECSTLALAPSILENFDITAPPYMSHLRVPEIVH